MQELRTREIRVYLLLGRWDPRQGLCPLCLVLIELSAALWVAGVWERLGWVGVRGLGRYTCTAEHRVTCIPVRLEESIDSRDILL